MIIALLVAAAATWGVIYVAFDDLSTGVERLADSAREAADELEARDDSIGRAAQDVDASRRVDLFADALEERVTGTDDVLESTAGTAPTYFIGGILTLFLMSYGPRLARSAVDQLPDPGHAARRRGDRDQRAPAIAPGDPAHRRPRAWSSGWPWPGPPRCSTCRRLPRWGWPPG